MVDRRLTPPLPEPENPPPAIDPERALALSYAPAAARPGVAALFALDDTLGRILRTTREPMVGQMRLTWWHTALAALDTAPPPAEPVLQALAAHVVPRVAGATLAGMIDAWEVLLDAELGDDATLEKHARRGLILFGAAATLLGAGQGDPVAPAGRGWALADLATHLSDPAVAARAGALAALPLATATAARWSRSARTLGALAHLAALDLAGKTPAARGSPSRVWRLLRHRLTGR